MSPTHQDLSNDTTLSQIKSCVPVPLNIIYVQNIENLERINIHTYVGRDVYIEPLYINI